MRVHPLHYGAPGTAAPRYVIQGIDDEIIVDNVLNRCFLLTP